MFDTEQLSEMDHVSSIRSKNVFWTLISVVFVIFFLGMCLLVVSDYRRAVTRANLQLSHFAELYEQAVNASLSVANVQMTSLLEDLSRGPIEDTATTEEQYGPALRTAVETIQQIDSLLLIAPNGEVIWSTSEALIGRNLGDRSYFQKALNLGVNEYTVGVPLISRGSGRRVTPIAWPLIDEKDRLLGVVASSLGEEYYSDLLSLNGIEPDMHVEIITSNGEAAFVSDNTDRDAGEALIEARKELPALDLYIHVTRSKKAVMRGYWQRTSVFMVVGTALFLSILWAAIRSRKQSLLLAEGLQRSEQDRLKIQAAQSEFDAIFENVGDGIVVFSDLNGLHRSNRKAREYLDVPDDQAAVVRLREMLPSLAEMESDLATYRIELSVSDRDGIKQAVQCRVMKLHLHGEDIAYCVLEDISAQERLASARAAFVTSVNHELRTPLTSLAGALEVFQDRFGEELPSGADRLLAMASRNADRLLVLVNDILTLQAIDQKQLSIAKEPSSAAEVLTEALATNSGYGLNRDVALTIDSMPDDTTGHILVDKTRVQQIFSNLISNAIKYSPSGGKVSLGAEVVEDSVVFHVRDEGPGIPKSSWSKLFERFAKPIHSRELQASGTGLGLAITKELVTRHDGKLTFDTRSFEDGEAKSGTSFYVHLPLHRALLPENEVC